jgi:hypothetical protein
VAAVRGLRGAAALLRAGNVDWRPLSDGDALYDEDRLRTFHGAWVRLVFDSGSVLRVDEESLVSLGGGVTVEVGNVEGKLQAGLRLRTPALELEQTPKRDIEFR